jgi:hypothetical protein
MTLDELVAKLVIEDGADPKNISKFIKECDVEYPEDAAAGRQELSAEEVEMWTRICRHLLKRPALINAISAGIEHQVKEQRKKN